MSIRKFITTMALIGIALVATACTYSESGCMVGHYCLIPFDGGSANAADWVPTDHASGLVEEVAAKCDAIAHGMEPAESGAFAFGQPAFVGSVMAATVLQNGMNRMSHVQGTIKNCMIMNGFRRGSRG